jgi:hypothetical protein
MHSFNLWLDIVSLNLSNSDRSGLHFMEVICFSNLMQARFQICPSYGI